MIKSFSGQVVFCFAILRAISAYVGLGPNRHSITGSECWRKLFIPVYFSKDPDGVQYFPGDAPTFPRGVQMLISLETHITCDFLSTLWYRACKITFIHPVHPHPPVVRPKLFYSILYSITIR